MSRISFYKAQFLIFLVFVPASGALSQQRANDFTKKVRSLDGRMNTMSSKRLSSSRVNSISNQRFSMREWPSKFSSFGGRRFPMTNKKTWGNERVETSKLDFELPHNQTFASENTKRTLEQNSENKTPASASVEFRDAYYAQLDKRVEDWMSKVNNMSLQDINRFQFRKGRPSTPGFPVQKAGSENLPMTSSEQRLGGSNIRGVTPSVRNSTGGGKSSYWLGPKKMVSSSTNGRVSTSTKAASGATQSNKNYRSYPKPQFGPKKVRVELK